MAVLLGTTATGANSANSNGSGIAFATRLQCSASGTVDSLFLRCGATVSSAANTHWAIYADGAGVPGTRLTADMNGTAFTASAYTSVPVSPGLAVVSGTFYWLAVNGWTTGFAYTDFATTGGNSSDDNMGNNPMVTPWAQSGGPFANIINMRAEGTASGGGADATEARADFEPTRFGPF
jgi:hypothetical protein